MSREPDGLGSLARRVNERLARQSVYFNLRERTRSVVRGVRMIIGAFKIIRPAVRRVQR